MIYADILDEKFEGKFKGIVAYIYELSASGGQRSGTQTI